MRFTGVPSALILTLVLVPVAWAGPSSRTTAAVSLGDSYTSGEAGRWNGNSLTPTGDKDGTDRACLPAGATCQVDKTRVYEKGTEDGGCHRSDVAEIKSAGLPVAERIDLSCSGAQTRNIFRASQGGVGQRGEPPQADKLLPVARDRNVKLIMLSIGGNDLGFASIIDYVQLLHGIFLAPLFGTFLLGMFWRRSTGWGGFFGLFTGTATGVILYLISLDSSVGASMYRAIWAWIACVTVTIAVSLVTQPKPESELRGIVWGLTDQKEVVEVAWYKKPWVLAVIVLAMTVALNIYFF